MTSICILAIDPGTESSGWVYFWNGKVVGAGVMPNHDVLTMIRESAADHLAIEMIASYGMPVGKEVFETCVWIGRMAQSWRSPDFRSWWAQRPSLRPDAIYSPCIPPHPRH